MTTVGVGVGVGLGGDVGVGVGVGGVVAVGVEVVAVPLPPHAVKRSAAAIANVITNQDKRTLLENVDVFHFMFMTITSSRFNSASITTSNACARHSLKRYAERLQYELHQEMSNAYVK